MKKRSSFLIYVLFFMGFALILISSCKKDEISKPMIDSITDCDGNVYHAIQIGTQTWMVENLRTTKYNDCSPILNVTDSRAWTSLTPMEKPIPAYCWYNNDSSNKTIYGALYNWFVVDPANPKKIAPKGWHIPSDAEWTILIDFLGGERVAGDKMRETGFVHWSNQNTSASNESGFTGLPGGSRYSNGDFNPPSSGLYGIWWSTETYSDYAYCRYMTESSIIGRNDYPKEDGMSIRCIKD